MLANTVPWSLSTVQQDPLGHFLFVLGKIGDLIGTFASVYFPIVDHLCFLWGMILSVFQDGALVVGSIFGCV